MQHTMTEEPIYTDNMKFLNSHDNTIPQVAVIVTF